MNLVDTIALDLIDTADGHKPNMHLVTFWEVKHPQAFALACFGVTMQGIKLLKGKQ